MTNPNDMQKLASAFMELWQKQMAGALNDPALVDMALSMTRAMQQGSIFTGAPMGAEKEAYGNKNPQQSAHDSSSGLSADGESALSGLERRIRACEQRLDAMDQQSKPKSSKSRIKPKR